MSFPPGSAINPNPLSVSFLIVPSGIATPIRYRAAVKMSPGKQNRPSNVTRAVEYTRMSFPPQRPVLGHLGRGTEAASIMATCGRIVYSLSGHGDTIYVGATFVSLSALPDRYHPSLK
jgi:hypothetical protein